MATISFTNSLNYTRAFTETELISILTNLNGSSNYFANGLNELGYIRIASGTLLLVDLNSHINRQLFEIYSFHFSVTNQFNLKLVHNDNALELNINDALLSVGYSGTIPISTLESVFMKMYTNSNQAYLLSHDIVKHTGNFGVEPAELKSLVAGSGIVLSNDANNLTITANITSLSNVYTQTEVDNLLNTKQDLIALLNDNTKIQLLNNSNVLKSISAGNNIVLTNDATSDQFLEISADLSSYYTQTEVSNLLSAINQAVSAPSVTGISLLNSDGKIRTIDTELPLMTTLNETIDPNGSVTESRITFKMQQQTSFSFGNSLFDSVTGTMRLAIAPTANDTPTVDNTKMSITPNGDVGVGTTTPQSTLHVVGEVCVDVSITGVF